MSTIQRITGNIYAEAISKARKEAEALGKPWLCVSDIVCKKYVDKRMSKLHKKMLGLSCIRM